MSNRPGDAFDISDLDTAFLFRHRPIAIPGDLRTTWKIALVILMLSKCCRGGKSSLTKLHVLNWAMRNPAHRDALRAAAAATIPPDTLLVRFEPSMNRAIDLGIGDGLIRRCGGGNVELTALGRAYAAEIDSDQSVLSDEKGFAGSIRNRITEKLINEIFGVRS